MAKKNIIRWIVRIVVATLLLYVIPVALYEGSTAYLQANDLCVGNVCMPEECPPGHAILVVKYGGVLRCENFEKYVLTRDTGLFE